MPQSLPNTDGIPNPLLV
jgi:phosphatidylinositol kinase/protein kinase (PI-3  family)